jgi:hypothetical protein
LIENDVARMLDGLDRLDDADQATVFTADLGRSEPERFAG